MRWLRPRRDRKELCMQKRGIGGSSHNSEDRVECGGMIGMEGQTLHKDF